MDVNRKRSRRPTIEILLADRIIVVQVNDAAEHANTEGDDLPVASPLSLFNADIAAWGLGLLATPGFRARSWLGSDRSRLCLQKADLIAILQDLILLILDGCSGSGQLDHLVTTFWTTASDRVVEMHRVGRQTTLASGFEQSQSFRCLLYVSHDGTYSLLSMRPCSLISVR